MKATIRALGAPQDSAPFTPSLARLDGQSILITGAGSGIGAQMACDFAKAGANVLLLGKKMDALEAVYDEICADNAHPKHAILPFDLSQGEMDFLNLKEVIKSEFGQLDGILHNAAILGDLTPILMYQPKTFAKVWQVNFTAPMLLTQVLFDVLSPNASVLFTSSAVAKVRAFWGAYAISKQACEALCSLLYQENQKTCAIRFNCINPAATRTNMRAHAYPGEDALSVKPPESLAPIYVHLMAKDCDINGALIDVIND